MKKIQLKRRKKASEAAPSRITNETVAEHREQILAGGRKFKYPRQYAKHRLVVNTIIISLVTLLALVLLGWWQLYSVQNTSALAYRVTRIIPVPVASVDGETVRYSDYLMRLTPSIRYLEDTERINLSSDDGKRQLEFFKRKALDSAIADTFAVKLARTNAIVIDDAAVDATVDQMLTTASGRISEDVYNASTLDIYGYTPEQYRLILRQALLRQEVAFAIDTKAQATKTAAEAIRKESPNIALSKLVTELKKKGHDVQAGNSGSVPKTNHDGGLAQTALTLKPGQTSDFIRSTTGDGYYLVQLVRVTDTQLSYNFLKVPLTAFDEQLKTLRQNNAIQEFISISK